MILPFRGREQNKTFDSFMVHPSFIVNLLHAHTHTKTINMQFTFFGIIAINLSIQKNAWYIKKEGIRPRNNNYFLTFAKESANGRKKPHHKKKYINELNFTSACVWNVILQVPNHHIRGRIQAKRNNNEDFPPPKMYCS